MQAAAEKVFLSAIFRPEKKKHTHSPYLPRLKYLKDVDSLFFRHPWSSEDESGRFFLNPFEIFLLRNHEVEYLNATISRLEGHFVRRTLFSMIVLSHR